MDLNEIAVFVKVVEMGSFSRAARQLGMPNSTVSAKVSALEKRLGVILIRRTTRKLFVTEAGQAFFERCGQGLERLKEAEDEISINQKDPQGRLRITAPISLGAVVLPTIMSEFRKKYPKVALDIELTDRSVDLISEGFDLAVRAGHLKDSGLKAKKLGTVYFAPFASPQYLKSFGTPRSPKDLRDHSCLRFTAIQDPVWRLVNGKQSIAVSIQPMIQANELNLIRALTVSGQGIALLPTFLCVQDLQQQKLIRILPEWRTASNPVHFVFPDQKFAPPKIAAFMSLAASLLSEELLNFEI